MSDWYVHKTAPQRELLAAEALRDRGYTVYVPTQRVRRRKGKRDQLKALFQSYLFVRYWLIGSDESDKIRDRTGRRMIIGPVTVCGRHEPIPDDVIGKIAEAAARMEIDDNRPPRAFQEGDICIIQSGAGEGKIGKITKLKKGDAAFEIFEASRSLMVKVKTKNLKLKEAA